MGLKSIHELFKGLDSIQVGDYTISIMKDGESVWIEHTSGEGGQFSIEDFEALIHGFYTTYF